jgi:hypothetical protein
MTQPAIYVGPTPAQLARIPNAFQARAQWVLWRGADRIDQTTGEIALHKAPCGRTWDTSVGLYGPACGAVEA